MKVKILFIMSEDVVELRETLPTDRLSNHHDASENQKGNNITSEIKYDIFNFTR